MKSNLIKLTTLLYIFTGIISISAQDDSESKISLETQFALINTTKISPNLKLRYFFSEQSALRIGLNFQYYDLTEEVLEVDGEGVGSIQAINSNNTIELGFERHAKNDRISPYLGGSLKFGFGKNNEFGSRTDSLVFINDFNYKSEVATSSFGVHLFTGVDVTIYEGLFIGTEIGYQFTSAKNKRGEFSTTDASSTTNASTTTAIPENKTKSFSLINMGVIRIGWKF